MKPNPASEKKTRTYTAPRGTAPNRPAQLAIAAALLCALLAPPARTLELALEENRAETGTIGYVDLERVFGEHPDTLKAKDNFKRFDSVKIQSISLSEAGCEPGKRSWYYLVHFTPIIDGSRVYSGVHFAAVLMDGTVVGPAQVKNDF